MDSNRYYIRVVPYDEYPIPNSHTYSICDRDSTLPHMPVDKNFCVTSSNEKWAMEELFDRWVSSSIELLKIGTVFKAGV